VFGRVKIVPFYLELIALKLYYNLRPFLFTLLPLRDRGNSPILTPG
jgi:hypothetical protein